MRGTALRTVADVAAVSVGVVLAPYLRLTAKHRFVLPRFQALADRCGFQLRSTHYYEPTYSLSDLPEVTCVERALPGIDWNEALQLELLAACHFGEELRAFPTDPPGPGRYGYRNHGYGFGDAEMLYNIIRVKKPRRIIEIGAGYSTLVARAAIEANRREDEAYACRQICIEPYEQPWLESTGAEVIRKRVEKIELELFDQLEADDILFIDSSHVIRPWGDVLREFQEVVPRVKPGVLIHVHDIFSPRDYPERWLRDQRRLWNEQYLLESFLAFNQAYEVVCAMNWLKHHHGAEVWAACPMLGEHPEYEPGAFWFRRK